jgi:hypothetical protein
MQRDIAKAADKIIEAIPHDERAKLGAVNWGDIGVMDVVQCKGMDGDEWLEVYIEEASPDAMLGSYVQKRLVEAFPGPTIAVRCEW